MLRKTSLCAATLGFTLSVAASLPLNGQSIGFSTRTDHGAQAEQLRSQAQALFERPTQYARAAALLERAADLLPLEEHRRVRDRSLAARLWYYSGHHSAARSAMKQAAGETLGLGHVVEAAHLYVDACMIALEQNKTSAARELYASARRLTASRSVVQAERAWLEQRLQAVAPKLANR